MLVPYARKNHTVSNFNPFHDFDELERAFFSDNALSEFKTDIQEDGDNFVLEADLPGFKKEDIHVDVADDRLTVTAERHSNFEDKDKKNKYVRCERSYGTYARSFDISGIDAAGIKAAYADGVRHFLCARSPVVGKPHLPYKNFSFRIYAARRGFAGYCERGSMRRMGVAAGLRHRLALHYRKVRENFARALAVSGKLVAVKIH